MSAPIGEFEFIARVTRGLGASPDVLLGVGDDCAVVRNGDRCWLFSCDASLESVHFRRDYSPPHAIGWKAAAAAISDIAAMGGQPRFLLVTLALPADMALQENEALYAGIREAAEAAEALIIGGDTTRSAAGWVIDITAIGEAPLENYVCRHGARPGDLLVVSGWPGLSGGGLYALRHQLDAPGLIQAHQYPQPRIALGQWAAREAAVHAMIDCSDGLAQDAGHLAEAAGLGVDLDGAAIPLHPELIKHHPEALACALSAGEDYELLFALDPAGAPQLQDTAAPHPDCPLSIVGRFTDRFSGIRLDGAPLEKTGFDHFASEP